MFRWPTLGSATELFACGIFNHMKTRPLSALFFCLPLMFSAVLVAPHAAAEQTNIFSDIAKGIPHSAFLRLSIEGDRRVAVGVGGSIMESDDGGQSSTFVGEGDGKPTGTKGWINTSRAGASMPWATPEKSS